MAEFLRYEQADHVVTLTMNQPEARNPLTGNTAVPELVAAFERIAADPSVRAVIVTGADPAFCAGGNMKDMKRYQSGSVDPVKTRTEYRLGIQRLTLAVYHSEVPTIAAVNGPAIGAGCDLTTMCDIRIASEKATFAESFIRVGIVPGDGGAWLLPRAVGASRAAEMAFTGEAIDAREALACGLVSRVVPHDALLPEARKLAARIAANPGETLRMTKRLLREGEHLRLESLLELSASFQALAHTTRQHAEAVNAFLEKRRPVFGPD
jgi:enoyl-CoA hydratase/carnithine racemase